jgi:small-conductance mechanosensitive channel
VEATDDTRFGRTHFVAYGPYSLEFEIVYFVLSDDYNLYLDRVQTINLKIKEAFEMAGIDIAYPTQVVQYQNTNDV